MANEIVMAVESLRLLSRKGVATILKCSVGTVDNLCRLGELTPIKFGTQGKCVRFLLSEVERFIASKLVATKRRVPEEGGNNA